MLGEKLPPNDIEAEASVIGSIIIDGDSLVKISGFLQPSDFNEAHEMLPIMQEMLERGVTHEKTLWRFFRIRR